ncbi:E1 protein [Panthera leo persica papillomavirus 1]|uniref:Replication protein E1 n=10 Tax=Panthera leo persica papillomavirus 1 TaxID=2772508 RepID=I6LEJ8_9PAPI|nr:E1 protein [Panthera leo persica papillomavirus 1]
MADKKGTECEDLSDWVLLEAECSDVDEPVEDVCDSASDISDLVDNASVHECQGLSLQLFRLQEQTESDDQLQQLKRKYIASPAKAVLNLSPRLQAVSISPQTSKKAKKQLVWDDSGVDLEQHEADDSVNQGQTQVETSDKDCETVARGGGQNGAEALFKSKNRRLFALGKFKENFGISYMDLVRVFQSHKTCSMDWVICGLYLHDERSEAAKVLLQDHCAYIFFTQMGIVTLMLLAFTSQKSRETVFKLLTKLFDCKEEQFLAEPPKTRSTAAALYWYKKSLLAGAFTFGIFPEWIAKQTLINHQLAAEKPFDLSVMIQWAYDNNITEESEIAYQYAMFADTDENAAAFLNSNNQAKHVRDCATMCRYYRRAEMQRMTMSEWIHKQCKGAEGDGDWKEVVKFLRYQGLEFVEFLSAFTKFLKGVPKRNCLVFWGPPNTGKSLFCMTLLKFLRGKVISYVNSRSQFWLQPLADAKVALLDDATVPCWNYFDTFLRNALDGNPVCIDCKHKAPFQIKCPPLLVTTNLNVKGDERWLYLHSRLSAFCFANEFPFKEDGSPGFNLNDQSWASFFKRFWLRLELSDQEDEGEDGECQQGLRVCTRATSTSV